MESSGVAYQILSAVTDMAMSFGDKKAPLMQMRVTLSSLHRCGTLLCHTAPDFCRNAEPAVREREVLGADAQMENARPWVGHK